jgi:hypothetical protein
VLSVKYVVSQSMKRKERVGGPSHGIHERRFKLGKEGGR